MAYLDGECRWRWHKVANGPDGFGRILAQSPPGNVLVMEASGPYYLQLATFLHGHGREVCVVNPLKVRRFAQMKFYRAKTDRKDAAVIAEYATTVGPATWSPDDAAVTGMQQILTALEGMDKQIGMVSQQLDAFTASGNVQPGVKRALEAVLAALEKEQIELQEELLGLAEGHYGDSMCLLRTIPGIGPKTAAMLVALTNNFRKFTHYKQLVAYVGLSPRIYQSGTSVNGRGGICKMGKAKARKMLYMCAWSAKRYNDGCVRMYERLKARGKPERVIKIAVANKLLKQAFAVVTSKQPYDKNYQAKLAF